MIDRNEDRHLLPRTQKCRVHVRPPHLVESVRYDGSVMRTRTLRRPMTGFGIELVLAHQPDRAASTSSVAVGIDDTIEILGLLVAVRHPDLIMSDNPRQRSVAGIFKFNDLIGSPRDKNQLHLPFNEPAPIAKADSSLSIHASARPAVCECPWR